MASLLFHCRSKIEYYEIVNDEYSQQIQRWQRGLILFNVEYFS